MEDVLNEVVKTTRTSPYFKGKRANSRKKTTRRARLKSGLVVYAKLLKSNVSRAEFHSRLDTKEQSNLALVETEAIRAQIETGVDHNTIIDSIVSKKAKAEAEKTEAAA